jgi:hypothetical protein
MRSQTARISLVTAVLAASGWLAVAAPAPAQVAAPPANDNYLASTRMELGERVARRFEEIVNTTGATTQPTDLFNPNRAGLPFGGGQPETLTCRGATFGATVWYDFAPEIAGGVEIVAGGYDTTVAVYEYDPRTARIGGLVACDATPGAGEQLQLPKVEAEKSYTIQVGGAGGATGLLDFKFGFFGDRDEDGVLDEGGDKCRSVPGIREAGGCPPTLATTVRVGASPAAGGVRLASLSVSKVPVGAKVQARCGRCGSSQTRVASKSTVDMTKFAGRFLRAGTKLEILVTRKRSGTGRYRFGAIGNYYRYDVRSGGLSARIERCLKPGKTTPLKDCT